MDTSEILLSASNIRKRYGTLPVLKGVNLSIKSGEVVSIVGSSGAGKSTLLHILGTLDTPDEGSIYFRNENIHSFSGKQLAAFRNNNIGFIFQFHHLLPEFTALENVIMPGLIANQKKSALEPRALMLLEKLGLKDRASHKPAELSGGEAQRVAVARALMNQPQLICADEPSGNLDSERARELHQLFFDLRKEFNITFLIVTHNEELANLSDRKLLMKDGCILSDITNPAL